MNIENLDTAELKQLQFLLNKMNPNQPTEKLYLDPVNKMIDEILDGFNFDRVQITMDYLNWKWVGERVTTKMLVKEARRLLTEVAGTRLDQFKDTHWKVGVTHSTGGFHATAYCNESKTKITGLELQFVLADWDYWDEHIED